MPLSLLCPWPLASPPSVLHFCCRLARLSVSPSADFGFLAFRKRPFLLSTLLCLSPSVSLSVSASQLTVSRFAFAEFRSQSPLSVVGYHLVGEYPE